MTSQNFIFLSPTLSKILVALLRKNIMLQYIHLYSDSLPVLHRIVAAFYNALLST